ncbi:MAG: DUF4837 domain-containing protein [Bacteroidetes bacterium HGW-Bacteroidetes-15]|nr:MAG: DUF4837 domain-containing protein [Bacteroidetes bacterium HGW-Bacteroidetes-15]
MKKLTLILLGIALLSLNYSCDKGTKGSRTLLPNVTGAAGEVVVVLSNSVIEESIGKTFKEILEEEYPMIPQSEPLFNVVMIPTSGFSDIFKTHRNVIIVKVDSEYEKAQIIPQRDVWAAPQTLLNIVGPTYPAIEELIKNDTDRLIQLLEQAERDRIVQNAIKFEAEGLRTLLDEKFDISMYFPKGYKIILDTTDFVWISYETPSTSQGIFVYQYPYTDVNTFTKEYLVDKRNSYLKNYVPGPTQGSYMITESVIPPSFKPLMFKGRYFGQLRGLWDVYSHPMGGPFISLTTIDEESNRVLTVEGYVYAPRFNKRNYLRQVEALLLTLTVNEKN